MKHLVHHFLNGLDLSAYLDRVYKYVVRVVFITANCIERWVIYMDNSCASQCSPKGMRAAPSDRDERMTYLSQNPGT